MKLQLFTFAEITPSKTHMFFQVKEGELLGVFPTHSLSDMGVSHKIFTGNILTSAIS